MSRILDEQQVPHALAGGLAVGLHGYNRWTTNVDFVVSRTARKAIEQLGPTTTKAERLKGISVKIDRVDVHFTFLGKSVRRADIASSVRLVGLPILGIDPLIAMKVRADRGKAKVDVVELLKLNKVTIEEVSRRLSGKDLAQFQDLVKIADLEKKGKPEESRRIVMAVLARAAGITLKSLKLQAVKQTASRPRMTRVMLRVASVQLVETYTVQLGLTDGSTRVMNLRASLKGPAFRALRKDISLFRKVRVEHGTLSWPTGQDLDPDVLLDTEISRRARTPRRHRMAAICQFDGLTVYMYSNGHPMPRVHVVSGSEKALVRINDGKVFEGSLPANALRRLHTWLALRRPEVALEWVRAQSGQKPRLVAPP